MGLLLNISGKRAVTLKAADCAWREKHVKNRQKNKAQNGRNMGKFLVNYQLR